MKKIILCFFFMSQVTVAMAPGDAPLNGHALHLLLQEFAAWIKRLREPTPEPSPNPAEKYHKLSTGAMPPHGGSGSSVRIYRNGKQVIVVAPEGYEVKILQSNLGKLTQFPDHPDETKDT